MGLWIISHDIIYLWIFSQWKRQNFHREFFHNCKWKCPLSIVNKHKFTFIQYFTILIKIFTNFVQYFTNSIIQFFTSFIHFFTIFANYFTNFFVRLFTIFVIYFTILQIYNCEIFHNIGDFFHNRSDASPLRDFFHMITFLHLLNISQSLFNFSQSILWIIAQS